MYDVISLFDFQMRIANVVTQLEGASTLVTFTAHDQNMLREAVAVARHTLDEQIDELVKLSQSQVDITLQKDREQLGA